jgi:hypothetical protein
MINLIDRGLYGRAAHRCVRRLAESSPKRYITPVMAYTYEIDADRRLVIATFSPDANLADADRLITDLHADPRHSLEFDRVYDCRAVTRLPPLSELRAVAELFRRRVDPAVAARRAIVVPPSGAAYGLSRMLQALLDLAGIELNIFKELDDAVDWAMADTAARGGTRVP